MVFWTDAYIGREHTANYDCAEMVIEVMRDHYKKDVKIPSTRVYYEKGNNYNNVIEQYVFSLFEKVNVPMDGDVVLMKNGKLLNHVGIYVVLNNLHYVLHCLERIGVILQKARDINKYTLQIDGYYRLKEEDGLLKDEINGTDCSYTEPTISN